MKFLQLSILGALLASVGCGQNEGRVASVTDMKSVLLYQHVAADRFRLLACPYEVDLDVSDCRNVYLTPEGDEYYFTGTPEQPRLFAPSQATVKGLMTVPIVVAGAVVSWVVLRKLRNHLDVSGVKKQLKGKAQLAKQSAKAGEEVVELTRGTYWRLTEELKDLSKQHAKLFKTDGRAAAGKGAKNVSYDEVSGKLKAEMQFMQEQFKIVRDALNDSRTYDRFFGRGASKPKHPRKIFDNYTSLYNKHFNKAVKAFNKNNGEAITMDSYHEVMESARRHADDMIDGDFLEKFTQLLERPDVLATVRSNKQAFRKGIAKAEAGQVTRLAQESVSSANGRKSRGVADYVVAAVGGLLAGSYLPDKIPQLDRHMFTKREWQRLFASDGSFKKPLRVGDSYVVVEKLTRHLRSKGAKVVIDEQAFFGLKK